MTDKDVALSLDLTSALGRREEVIRDYRKYIEKEVVSQCKAIVQETDSIAAIFDRLDRIVSKEG